MLSYWIRFLSHVRRISDICEGSFIAFRVECDCPASRTWSLKSFSSPCGLHGFSETKYLYTSIAELPCLRFWSSADHTPRSPFSKI